MTLRGFHIVFIILSMLLSFGLAWFEFTVYRHSQSAVDLVVASFSTAAGAALFGYGIWFIKKSRRLAL